MTAAVIYKGALRCEAIHEKSGTLIETDAPLDNKGKGAKFSPSDLLAAALGSCIITTIGIHSEDWSRRLEGTRLEVSKVMAAAPRRIAEINVDIFFPAGHGFSDKERIQVENTAHACPVAKSLHPDIQQNLTFHW